MANIQEEQLAIMPRVSTHPTPATVTKIIKRLRAMTLKLLPIEVDQNTLNDPISRIITPRVISAYNKAAGDFQDALPYALLRARESFMRDAGANPSDYDENLSRAVACEVIARRIIHGLDPEKMYAVLSNRMRYQERDGDSSALSSALENAIDQHCTIFLSSTECQTVVNSLWTGEWIQHTTENNDIAYVMHKPNVKSFWDHLDPSRLCVPQYQNWFRMLIWVFFLFVYSQTVLQPTEMTAEPRHAFDAWEYLLYGMALALTFEDMDKIYSTLRLFTWRALNFWHVVSIMTDILLLSAFTFRIIGIKLSDDNNAATLKLQSFQDEQVTHLKMSQVELTNEYPELITVADGFKYIGTMQICIARMLKESGIFFLLLAVVGAGFVQSMYAIDVADGHVDRGVLILNSLVQGLLGSPDFENQGTAWALWIYYLWNVFTTIILLNILISLFSQAYSDVTDDASAHFLAFFAGKTIAMIRAPDEFVYPAPFNLIEIFVVAPSEWFVARNTYAKLNRVVMSIVFFIPLLFIALIEARFNTRANKFMANFFNHIDEGEEDDPTIQNPSAEDEDNLKISKTSFEDLIKAFPDSNQSTEASILAHIQALSEKIDQLKQQIEVQKKD